MSQSMLDNKGFLPLLHIAAASQSEAIFFQLTNVDFNMEFLSEYTTLVDLPRYLTVPSSTFLGHDAKEATLKNMGKFFTYIQQDKI